MPSNDTQLGFLKRIASLTAKLPSTGSAKDSLRLGQRQFPAKYKGHMVNVMSDGGGGHKAHVYHGKVLRYTSKRSADPENAFHQAKVWIDDNHPAKDSAREEKREAGSSTYEVGDTVLGPFGKAEILSVEEPTNERRQGKIRLKQLEPWSDEIKPGYEYASNSFELRGIHQKRLAQISQLQNPDDQTIVQADPDLEALRQQAIAIQQKVQEVTAQAQQYIDALANKTGQASGSGMIGLQQEATRIQQELDQKLLALPQNFIRFADGVTKAKKQNAKLADPAWGSMIDNIRTRGRGVMKRVTIILDRLSILYQKLTASVTIQEFGPGELDPKKMTKFVQKNKDNSAKIDKYVEDQKTVAPNASKYLLDEASGRVQVPYAK